MGSIPTYSRVAAIYDIHGNLPALDAVLREIENAQIDVVVVGGDVAWGPVPGETVARLRSLGESTLFIRGNTDREVADRAGREAGLDEIVSDINAWCADRLSDDDLDWLRGLARSVVLDVEGLGSILFCHGSPRSDEEMLTPGTPARRMAETLEGVAADVVVCGHTHMQFDVEVNRKRVVNAGSVGLPYESEPGAYWALIGPAVELRMTRYDVDAAIIGMSRSGCPHAEMVFFDTLRDPPPQVEVIGQFEATAVEREF